MGLMDGKICLVTGGNAGVGLYTALEVARMGGSVILIGRNQAKCEEALKLIRAETGSQSVEYLLADLSSQAQIRAAARRFNEKHDRLDVLVNNAGGAYLRRTLTVDGIERTFAVNHLAYFLLTHLVMGALRNSPNARILNVSSGGHYNQQLDFDNLQLKKSYNVYRAYGRTKLANILFTYELSRRLEGMHITSNALTPGIVATGIWGKVVPLLAPLINPVIRRRGQTPLEGAQTSIYLATSPEVKGVTGKYYAHCKAVRSSEESYDLETAKRLWEISLELTGLDEYLG